MRANIKYRLPYSGREIIAFNDKESIRYPSLKAAAIAFDVDFLTIKWQLYNDTKINGYYLDVAITEDDLKEKLKCEKKYAKVR